MNPRHVFKGARTRSSERASGGMNQPARRFNVHRPSGSWATCSLNFVKRVAISSTVDLA